jgi:hypothetical protein
MSLKIDSDVSAIGEHLTFAPLSEERVMVKGFIGKGDLGLTDKRAISSVSPDAEKKKKEKDQKQWVVVY